VGQPVSSLVAGRHELPGSVLCILLQRRPQRRALVLQGLTADGNCSFTITCAVAAHCDKRGYLGRLARRHDAGVFRLRFRQDLYLVGHHDPQLPRYSSPRPPQAASLHLGGMGSIRGTIIERRLRDAEAKLAFLILEF